MNDLQTAMELSPAEIDAVSGGHKVNVAVGDLVVVDGDTVKVTALNGNKVTLKNILNHDSVVVPINVAAAILGAPRWKVSRRSSASLRKRAVD